MLQYLRVARGLEDGPTVRPNSYHSYFHIYATTDQSLRRFFLGGFIISGEDIITSLCLLPSCLSIPLPAQIKSLTTLPNLTTNTKIQPTTHPYYKNDRTRQLYNSPRCCTRILFRTSLRTTMLPRLPGRLFTPSSHRLGSRASNLAEGCAGVW